MHHIDINIIINLILLFSEKTLLSLLGIFIIRSTLVQMKIYSSNFKCIQSFHVETIRIIYIYIYIYMYDHHCGTIQNIIYILDNLLMITMSHQGFVFSIFRKNFAISFCEYQSWFVKAQ